MIKQLRRLIRKTFVERLSKRDIQVLIFLRHANQPCPGLLIKESLGFTPYATLKKLEKLGYVTSEWGDTKIGRGGDLRRLYYLSSKSWKPS